MLYIDHLKVVVGSKRLSRYYNDFYFKVVKSNKYRYLLLFVASIKFCLILYHMIDNKTQSM